MRVAGAALLSALGLGLAGCASDAASTGTAPLAVVRAAQTSLAGAHATKASARSVRAVRRRSAVDPDAASEPTPRSPLRSRTPAPARALPVSAAPRLAALACEQYAAGRAGTFPDAVRARGSTRALALLTDSVAAALLGMPIAPPGASVPARERLDEARARIERWLAAGDDARATASARATAPRIADYAQALGIDGCG